MALIKCPECGREISDKATACPGCGYPMTPAAAPEDERARLLAEARERDKKTSIKIGILMFIGICIMLSIVYFCARSL